MSRLLHSMKECASTQASACGMACMADNGKRKKFSAPVPHSICVVRFVPGEWCACVPRCAVRRRADRQPPMETAGGSRELDRFDPSNAPASRYKVARCVLRAINSRSHKRTHARMHARTHAHCVCACACVFVFVCVCVCARARLHAHGMVCV